jgi:hypothetical protein
VIQEGERCGYSSESEVCSREGDDCPVVWPEYFTPELTKAWSTDDTGSDTEEAGGHTVSERFHADYIHLNSAALKSIQLRISLITTDSEIIQEVRPALIASPER